MYRRHSQVNLLVPNLQVNVSEAQVRLPDQGSVTLRQVLLVLWSLLYLVCLEGLGVHLQGVGYLLWKLQVLSLELRPELS